MKMEIVFPGGKRVDAHYEGFTIRTDQSRENGGESSAPAPFDLFLSSIGTCTGIYVLGFCQQRDIPTTELRLTMNTERDERTRLIRKISMEIQLPPEFPDKYKDAIVRAANLCTVKKHLQKPPEIEIVAKK